MNKSAFTLIVFFSVFFSACGQYGLSTNGLVTTPRGDFHALVVFVSFYEDSLDGQQEVWPYDELPIFARGENNELFNANPDEIGERNNISKWYSDMSMGKFRFTADVFPEPIMVKKHMNSAGVPINTLINKEVFAQLRRKKDINWSKYDKRKNGPGWSSDNQNTEPDGKLDYVILMYRGPNGGGLAGIQGGPFPLSYEDKKYEVRNGFTSVRTGYKQANFLVMFTHEFGHNLWNAVHIGGANGVTGPYFHASYAWGMACPDRRLFFTANAWERWYLGWAEITYDLDKGTDSGVYWVDDFVTTGDAIRIKIPHTEDQYLWLENHQKINPFDRNRFEKNANGEDFQYPRKGLVAYVERISGSRSNIHSFSKHANGIHPIDPSGCFDFRFEKKEEKVKRWWGQKQYDFISIQPNPISGQNSISLLRGDFNDDGFIGYSVNSNHPRGGNEYEAMFRLNGEPFDGAFGEGFYWRPLQKIGVGTNPMLKSISRYDKQLDVHEAVLLNNLSVQILGYENGKAKVKVDFTDASIATDQVWCGENIELPTGPDSLRLILESGVELRLKQGYTPWYSESKQIIDSTHVFVGKTSLKLGAGTKIVLKPLSKLYVENNSSLKMEGDAYMIIEDGAAVIIKKGSHFILSPASIIELKHKKSVIFLKGFSEQEAQEIKKHVIGPGKVILCNSGC